MVQGKKSKKKVADFSKPKVKLGKGKLSAANSTDTSFKSRSIALPTQRIAVEKELDLPTTKRNLALDQLLIQTKHYSAAVRKDSVLGLKELLVNYPHLLKVNLNVIVGATARNITDEDRIVRDVTYGLYSHIFSVLPEDTLRPHSSTILLHATSALSHIFADVRVDSLRFLDLVVGRTPTALTGSIKRVVDGYLSIFGLRGKIGDPSPSSHGTTSSRLSNSAKARVLESLLHFVQNASRSPSLTSRWESDSDLRSTVPCWIFGPSFLTEDAFRCFVKALSTHEQRVPTASWQVSTEEMAEADCNGGGAADWEFLDGEDIASLVPCAIQELGVINESQGLDDEGTEWIEDLAQRIHSILVSTFLDVAPSVFTYAGSLNHRSNGQLVEFGLLRTIGNLALSIYGPLLRRDIKHRTQNSPQIERNTRLVLQKMAVYFPFRLEGYVSRDIKWEQALHDLNLAYCELRSLLALLESQELHGTDGIEPQLPIDDQMEQVGDWIIRTLQGELTPATCSIGLRLSAVQYAALLPSIWSLLSGITSLNAADRIWLAVVEHCESISVTSWMKRLAIEFVGRLVLLKSERSYHGSFNVETAFARRWLESLPQVLWEIGTQDVKCTETILRILHVALNRRVVEGGVVSLLVPFFGVSHPARGWIVGPWGRLMGFEDVRNLGVDVMVIGLGFVADEASRRQILSAVDDAIEACVPMKDVGKAYWFAQSRRVMGGLG